MPRHSSDRPATPTTRRRATPARRLAAALGGACTTALLTVGLLQGCAQRAAAHAGVAGQDFRTILRTYYPGTSVEPAE